MDIFVLKTDKFIVIYGDSQLLNITEKNDYKNMFSTFGHTKINFISYAELSEEGNKLYTTKDHFNFYMDIPDNFIIY